MTGDSPHAAPGLDLFDALAGSQAGRRGTLRSWTGTHFEETPWPDVLRGAERKAAGLVDAGVEPGSAVAAVLTNSRDAVEGVLGIWLAGGTVASLPVPARGMDLATWGKQLGESCQRVQAAAFVSDDGVLAALESSMTAVPIRTGWSSLERTRGVDPQPPQGERVAFVQFSSGSTSDPKGCCLTERAISAQLELSLDATRSQTGSEVVVCWLPLSHDFGMFGGLLFSWVYDFDLVLSSPERFLGAPRTWFDDCVEHGATMTGGPPSALRYATRAARGRAPGALGLRACGLGAERVEWSALEEAVSAFGPSGLRMETLQPSYGLAEATLTVTTGRSGEAPRAVRVDPEALAHGEVRDTTDPEAGTIVSAGRPCRGVTVTTGTDADRVGEIRVRSPSLAVGYAGDPEKTASRFRDGELLTGDLGFMRDGELYVVGRLDDMINVGGRNIYAGELESAAGGIEGIRSGCCTLVEVEGPNRTRLVMLAEVRDEDAPMRELAREAALAVAATSGVTLDECVFLPKGALPKTPSGKIQRYRARGLVHDERAALARVVVSRS